MDAILENINQRRDPRSYAYPMFGSYLSPLVLMSAYLLIVRVIGPAYMKNRPPMKLNKLMVVYNAVQMVMSAFVFQQAIKYGWGGRYNYICQPFDATFDTFEDRMGIRCTYIYFLTKLVDLLDTIFIVARKKDKQLSFLHVYHHALMIGGVWIAFAFSPGGHLTFLGLLNSFVHVVMYSYYLLTAWKPEYKNNIWWKKHITQLQLLQFFLIAFHSFIVYIQPNCDVSRWLNTLVFTQNVFMIKLFWNFYSKAYLSKPSSSNHSKKH